MNIEFKLPLTDSVILATARHCRATIWTQDSDFQDIEGVKFIPKRRGGLTVHRGGVF